MSQITKENFNFLQDLHKNNNRGWFEKNKNRYEKQYEEIISFADAVLQEVRKFDEIETPSGKKSLHRIYRDIRFSKDKTPYKTHWSGGFKRAGKGRRGGMYFHIEKGCSAIAGGFWVPDAGDILHIRKQIVLDAKPLRDVITSRTFKTYFGALKGEQLKTVPKGFDKEDPEIDLLRYKQFLLWHPFGDEEVIRKDFYKKVAEGFQRMHPFFDVMTNYLTTDLNGENRR